MNKLKFELNKSGVRQMLRSPEAMAVCQQYAQQVYARCPNIEGYVIKEKRYPERNGYIVTAEDFPAIRDNLENNTLLKARGW